MGNKIGLRYLIFVFVAIFGASVLNARETPCKCQKGKFVCGKVYNGGYMEGSCPEGKHCLSGRDGYWRCCEMKSKADKAAYRATCSPTPYCLIDSDCPAGYPRCLKEATGKINYCCKGNIVSYKDCWPERIVCTTDKDCKSGYTCVENKDQKRRCCKKGDCEPDVYCVSDGDCTDPNFSKCVVTKLGINFCCKAYNSPFDTNNCRPKPTKDQMIRQARCAVNADCTNPSYPVCRKMADGYNQCCEVLECREPNDKGIGGDKDCKCIY